MNKAKKSIRRDTDTYTIGVDIGGTFTDIVALGSRESRILVAKVLTDYQDLARGVMAGIEGVLRRDGIDPKKVSRVVHGTTLVTNSLIERRGAKTALIVTHGFGDVLEMGRESRYDIYDVDIEMPVPIVPRDWVFEVKERANFKGEIVVPLDEKSVAEAIRRLRDLKIESVAVCLLHSYATDAHEKRIAALIAQKLPGVSVSLSCEVMPDLREYERTSTTAANAYVRPIVKGYLDRLGDSLRDLGIRSQLSIITSDGGVIDVETAARFPVRLTESGPAGGATAASYLGAAVGKPNLIAYDMGGTTAKICVIDSGKPYQSNSFEFGRVYRFAKGSGLPLQIPVIEMIEIGAGGGSIAHVNELDMLQVGPLSANADPGPACYGLGGTRPTVTDADLVLGYLAEKSFLGGAMHLDMGRARESINKHVARPLRMSIEDAAYAIHRVVNANMARAAKVHCLEQGNDPRQFSLFAYGGAGPVHAYGVAQLLGSGELLYPLRAGVMSALGFLVAKPSFEVLHGKIESFSEIALANTNTMLIAMEREAAAVVRNTVPDAIRLEVLREVAVRYEGQSFELFVPVPSGKLERKHLARIAKDFSAAYARRYHALPEHDQLETVRWRVRVTASDKRKPLSLAMTSTAATPASSGKRAMYVSERKRFENCPVYDRYALRAGYAFPGPAVVEEHESTVYLGADAKALVMPSGDLSVTLNARAPAKSNRKGEKNHATKVR